ncbi:MAG: hypothetical protein LBE01_05655 [Deltaproteobacteria bacterium]|nr:hypothetical protein [Deltaproteobacteria bacterium]
MRRQTKIALVVGLALFGFIVAGKLLSRLSQVGFCFGSTIGPSSYSASAVGYALLYETLAAQGLSPQRLLRDEPSPPPAKKRAYVALDPVAFAENRPQLLMAKSHDLLIVPPKYRYGPMPDNPRWIGQSQPIAPRKDGFAERLPNLGLTGEILLVPPPAKWEATLNDLAPTLSAPAQLIKSNGLTPIIAAPEGILLGKALGPQGQTYWVLADPDVLNNHGLQKGDNLALALAIFKAATNQGDGVVFDEPAVGSNSSPLKAKSLKDLASANGALRRLSIGQIALYAHIALAALLAALTASGRFGPPKLDESPLGFGREKLIENGARLLERAKKPKTVALGYFSLAVRSAAKAARLPKGLTEREIRERLENAVPRFSLAALKAEIDRAKAPTAAICLKWARAIYAFKARIENGSQTNRRPR